MSTNQTANAPATRREAVDLAKYALEEAENYQPRYDICTFYATMAIAYATLAPLLPATTTSTYPLRTPL